MPIPPPPSFPPTPSTSNQNIPSQPITSSTLPSSSVIASGNPRNASPLPIIVALILIVSSTVLIFISKENLFLHLVGYVLTPISVVFCLAWDTISQRKATHDVWFSPKILYQKFLRFLTLISFVVALFHIQEIALWFAELS